MRIFGFLERKEESYSEKGFVEAVGKKPYRRLSSVTTELMRSSNDDNWRLNYHEIQRENTGTSAMYGSGQLTSEICCSKELTVVPKLLIALFIPNGSSDELKFSKEIYLRQLSQTLPS